MWDVGTQVRSCKRSGVFEQTDGQESCCEEFMRRTGRVPNHSLGKKQQSLRLFPTDRPGHTGMDELPNRQTRVLKTLSDGQAEFPTIAWAKSKSP